MNNYNEGSTINNAETAAEAPVSPQTTSPTLQTALPPKKPSRLPFFLLIIFSILLVIGAVLGLQYINRQLWVPTGNEQPIKHEDVEPITENSSSFSNILFIDDSGNIKIYNPETGVSSNITTDAMDSKVWYGVPNFIDQKNVVYQRCERMGLESKDPYTCKILMRSADPLIDELPREIYSQDSIDNGSDYHIGAEITPMRVSPDKNMLATLTSTPNSEEMALYAIYLDGREIKTIDNFVPNPGRGSGYSDDAEIDFSPDGSKLLFTWTFMLPSMTDSSSMFAYDLSNFQNIWTSPANEWWAFGRWVNNNEFFAKKYSSKIEGSTAINTGELLMVNPDKDSAPRVVSGKAGEQYGFENIDGNQAIFFEIESETDAGTLLKKIDLVSGEESMILEDLITADSTSSVAYVYVLNDCGQMCGMGSFNGYERGNLAVLDLKTNKLTPIPNSSHWYSFDVLE